MILLPARERNIRGEKFDFAMGKGKSTDVFPCQGGSVREIY